MSIRDSTDKGILTILQSLFGKLRINEHPLYGILKEYKEDNNKILNKEGES